MVCIPAFGKSRLLCLISILLLTTAAPLLAASEEVTLPQELEVLVAGWEDNMARIRSCSVEETLTVNSAEYASCTDLEGKSYAGHTAHFRFVRDGSRRRIDTVFDRMFDVQVNKVIYQLPYGEYILRNPSVEQKEQLHRDKGVTTTTTRMLVLETEMYRYNQESKQLRVAKPERLLPLPSLELGWVVYSSPLYYLGFRDYAMSKVRGAVSVKVEKATGGEHTVRFVRKAPAGDDARDPIEVAIVIDAERGYTIKSVRTAEKGRLVGSGDYEYVERGGAWILRKARSEDADSVAEFAVDLNTCNVNEPVDAELFSVDSLQIAEGAWVSNQITGVTELYKR